MSDAAFPRYSFIVEHNYQTLVERVKRAAQPPLSWRVYGQQGTPDGGERYDLLLVHVPAGAGLAAGSTSIPPWHVLLNGGTHGDEPAGAAAMVAFLEERRYARWPHVTFTVSPCLNPWGYVHGRREGPGGVDLNRSFRRARRATPEVSLLKRALRRRHFDALIDCHEDVDAPGLYVFAEAGLGRAIVEAAGTVGPLHPGPDVDGEIPLKESVVVLDDMRSRQRRRVWRTWPLPFYVARYHRRLPPTALSPTLSPTAPTPPDVAAAEAETEMAQAVLEDRRENVFDAFTATVETPTSIPLDQRVAMHLAALDGALAWLTR